MARRDGLVHDRRWRLTRLLLEWANLDGLCCMLSSHLLLLLMLLLWRTRLSLAVLLCLRWRLYRALVDDLCTTLHHSRVSHWNLVMSGRYFSPLYYDLLRLWLRLTCRRQLVNDVWRVLLLLLLLLVRQRSNRRLRVGNDNLVVLLHSR